MNEYEYAKNVYLKHGIDTDGVIETLSRIPVSVHCWQGDDVLGFDGADSLSGGIQATGDYIGRARNFDELKADIDKAFSLIPGAKKLNLHASYAVFENGERAGRDKLQPRHFDAWVKFANERNIGIDFNPTFFSHEMVKDDLTLTSPDESVRRYWVEHGKCCLKIAQYFAEQTKKPCVMNIWIPDGYKNPPADRLSPRRRFAQSLDEILSVPYDKSKVYVTVESKVFGIGLESFTAGSAEFCLGYALSRNITPLFDNGHYHPTESVADKISSALLYSENLALHITRAVRWDSDHVVLFDDETRNIAEEIVRCKALDRVFIATDYFDASINRIAAWVTGLRSVQKALLSALLQPHERMRKLQESGDFTALMALQEELKTAPLGIVWEEYLKRENVNADYIDEIREYERKVLVNRG